MHSLIALLAMLFLGNAPKAFAADSTLAAAPAACGETEMQTLSAIRAKFEAGQATKSEVKSARSGLYHAINQCGDVPKADFCKAAVWSQEMLVSGINSDIDLGVQTNADLDQAKADLASLKQECK